MTTLKLTILNILNHYEKYAVYYVFGEYNTSRI
jgi:hypothetical protein